MSFKLAAGFAPEGDQPQAIDKLVAGLDSGEPTQVLLGVTGSGKSVAWDEPVLVRTERPDGGRVARLGPIGALLDAAFEESPESRVCAPGDEVVAPPRRVEALSGSAPRATSTTTGRRTSIPARCLARSGFASMPSTSTRSRSTPPSTACRNRRPSSAGASRRRQDETGDAARACRVRLR